MMTVTPAELARLRHQDPAFAGYRLITATGAEGIVVKCMLECCHKVRDPREALPPPSRPFVRVTTIEAARDWAVAHARRRHRP
jgi:hypothetical protein